MDALLISDRYLAF